jgi:hypothetical protein
LAKTPVPASATPAEGKPEVDHELNGLMSEIEADIREEELQKIWKKYSGVFVAFAVALVLGVLGVQLFRQYETKTRTEIALSYDNAAKQLDSGDPDKALAAFTDIAGRRFAGGYNVLARMGEAAAFLKKNDEAGAAKIYTALSTDSGVDPAFRDLATILRALHSMDTANPKDLEAALAPVTSPDNAFSFSALELSAVLSAKQGNSKHASELLERILGDPTAPAGVRQRATDLAALYKPAEAAAAAPADMPVPVKAPAPVPKAPVPKASAAPSPAAKP